MKDREPLGWDSFPSQVRAHAMHTLRVTLSNPTPLPVGLFVASARDARSFSRARDGRSTGA